MGKIFIMLLTVQKHIEGKDDIVIKHIAKMFANIKIPLDKNIVFCTTLAAACKFWKTIFLFHLQSLHEWA